MINLIPFLTQVSIEGLEEASKTSVLASLLVTIILVLFIVQVYIFKLYLTEIKINRINDKEKFEHLKIYNTGLEKIRENIQKKEDEKFEKSIAAEKEMINVLNGVNSVMSLNDKMIQKDNKLILEKLNEILKEIKN